MKMIQAMTNVYLLIFILVIFFQSALLASSFTGVRLRAGVNNWDGRIEVKRNGRWGTVCDFRFDKTAADVVCRQLGFEAAEELRLRSHYGAARGPIWISNVKCTGNETNFSHCDYTSIHNYYQPDRYGYVNWQCSSNRLAGVVCVKPAINQNDYNMIRFEPDKDEMSDAKLVEMQVDGSWYKICEQSWTTMDAIMACRQIGMYAAKKTLIPVEGGDVETVVELNCNGEEDSVQRCPQILRNISCQNYAAVVCSPAAPDISIDIPVLERSIILISRENKKLTCAKEERCVSASALEIDLKNTAGRRKLLSFSSYVQNFGTNDFRPPTPKGSWHRHKCHNHFHSITDFATYELLQPDGVKVASGHKVSFCLQDSSCVYGYAKKYKCSNRVKDGNQGISVGCSDHYGRYLDCQWIDVTDVSPGKYKLKISSNPYKYVPELDYTNNIVVCDVEIGEHKAMGENCIWEYDFSP